GVVNLAIADGAGAVAIEKTGAEGLSVQVWKRDGSALVREEPLTRPGREQEATFRGRLSVLGDGFLLCENELLWVPAGAEGRAWRFGIGEDPALSRPNMMYNRFPYYTGAAVVGDLLFVGCRDGGIYVFSVPAIVSATR